MNLIGPQSDRNLLLDRINSNRTELNYPQSKHIYDNEIAQLRNENKNLHDQLRRTLKELKAYQLRYPSAYENSSSFFADSNLDEEDDKPWSAASSEVISPLLTAYDTRINELEFIVKDMTANLDRGKEHITILNRENDELREAQLGSIRKSVDGTDMRGGGGLGPSGPLQVELLAEFNEKVDILMDENSLLVEQKVLLSTELDKTQEELYKKTQEINIQSNKINTLSTELQKLSIKASQFEKERNEAANQALSLSDSLGKSEIELETMSEQLDILRKKCREADIVALDYRKRIKALNDRAEDDGLLSMRRVKAAEDRVRELHSLLSVNTQELDASKEVNRKLRSEYQNTRQDAEGMLQVMSGLERQLNEYSNREVEVEKLAKDSKEKMEEALTLKEQFLVREDQCNKEIERLLQERKSIALQRKDDVDAAIAQTKVVFEEKILSFENEVQDLTKKNAQLLFDVEKTMRESIGTKEAASRIQRSHEQAHASFNTELKNLSEQLVSVTRSKEQETSRRLEMQDHNKELRFTIDKIRTQLDSARSQGCEMNKAKEVELVSMSILCKDLQKDIASKSRILVRQAKELEDLKASMQSQLTSAEKRFEDESALYRRKASEADRLVSELSATGTTDDVRTQALVDQLKEKYSASVAHLEGKLQLESEQLRVVSLNNRNAETVIGTLVEEKASLLSALEASKELVALQEEDATHCRSTINDLTGQLSASHNAREAGVLRAARAMEGMGEGHIREGDDKDSVLSAWVTSAPITSASTSFAADIS